MLTIFNTYLPDLFLEDEVWPSPVSACGRFSLCPRTEVDYGIMPIARTPGESHLPPAMRLNDMWLDGPEMGSGGAGGFGGGSGSRSYYGITINGDTVWELLEQFADAAALVSSSYALSVSGGSDSVLMRKFIWRVNVTAPYNPVLGDVYVDKKGHIQYYVNSRLKWQDVGKIRLTNLSDSSATPEAWADPVIDVVTFASNSVSPTAPENANVGDLWVRLYDDAGYSGFWVYEYTSTGVWSAVDGSRIYFGTHIEIPISYFPSSSVVSFAHHYNASNAYTTTSYYDLRAALWGTTIARATAQVTNSYSIKMLSFDEPTTFVLDVNSLRAASPATGPFVGGFKFIFLHAGDICRYTYKMESVEGPCAYSIAYTTSAYDGKTPLTVYPPSSGSTRTMTETGATLPTLEIPAGIDEDGELKIFTPTTIVPYLMKDDVYTIPETWLYPAVAAPGASRKYMYPASVIRNTYGIDYTSVGLFNTDNPKYKFTGGGGFNIFSATLSSDPADWTGNEKTDDGTEPFPHTFVTDGENVYHCDSISVGISFKFSAEIGVKTAE